MITSTIFQNGRSQAVRIPLDARFPDDVKKVEIIPLAGSLEIVPVGNVWGSFFDEGEMSEDFMADGREQPENQEREGL